MGVTEETLRITNEIVYKGKNEARQLNKSLKDTDSNATKSEKSLKKMGIALAAGAAAAGLAVKGFRLLGAGLKESITLAAEQQRVETQLAATLKSTGNAAGLSAEELKKLASELQNTTTFGDEAIIASESLLLTFTKIGGETFPRAQAAILDVSTAMGQDLQSATVAVGKALNDPIAGITALSRQGIQFSEDQKETIKTMVEMGDAAGAQALILGELETQFGGSAAAAADTFGGRMTQLQNVIGDVGETIGDQFLPGLQILGEEAVPAILSVMQELNPEIESMGEGFSNFAESLVPVIENADNVVRALINIEKWTKRIVTLGLSELIPMAIDQAGFTKDVAEETEALAEQLELLIPSGEDLTAVTARTNALFGETAVVVEEATEATDDLTASVRRFGAFIPGSAAATERMADAHDQLVPAANAATLSLENETEAVRALFAGFEKLNPTISQAFPDALAGADEATTSLSAATSDLDQFIFDLGVEMGATGAEMALLATATGDFTQAQIDAAIKAVEFEVKLQTIKDRFAEGSISVYQFRDAVQDLFNEINNLQDKTVTVTVNTVENGRVTTQGGDGPGISEYAVGTSSAAGGMAMVGEFGPEMVRLPRGAQVVSTNQTHNESTANTFNASNRKANQLIHTFLRRASRPNTVRG